MLDAPGQDRLGGADIGGDPIVVVLTETASDTHLAGLRKDSVCYMFGEGVCPAVGSVRRMLRPIGAQ